MTAIAMPAPVWTPDLPAWLKKAWKALMGTFVTNLGFANNTAAWVAYTSRPLYLQWGVGSGQTASSTGLNSTSGTTESRVSGTSSQQTNTVTNDTYINSIAVVSTAWLGTLPPDLKKIVIDSGAAVESKAQQWEFDFSKKLVGDWTALGGTVHTLPADDLAKMKTLLDPVADEVTKNQPPVHDMLQMVRAAAAKH